MPHTAFSRFCLPAILGGALVVSVWADPPQFDPNTMKPSAFSEKSFSWGSDQNKDKAQSSFSTSYKGYDKSFATKSADTDFVKSASIGGKEFVPPSVSMNKSYAVRSYPLPANFTEYDKNSKIPLKSSSFDQKSALGFNKNIEMPTYRGPEAQKIKNDMEAIDKTLGTTKNLPDRQLSVSEVRDLLNHNKKPTGDSSNPDAAKN